MSDQLLYPNLEERIRSFVKIEEQQKMYTNKSKLAITISREFGCEAYPLAEALKRDLEVLTENEWGIYDNIMIEKIREDKHLTEVYLKYLGAESTVLDFMDSYSNQQITQNEVFENIVEFIMNVSTKGNSIVIGQGGAIITKDIEHCLHFRLEAPFEYRASSIARRLKVSIDEATQIVRTNQDVRKQFINKYFSTKINDNCLYDMVFNNSRIPTQIMSRIICKLAKNQISNT